MATSQGAEHGPQGCLGCGPSPLPLGSTSPSLNPYGNFCYFHLSLLKGVCPVPCASQHPLLPEWQWEPSKGQVPVHALGELFPWYTHLPSQCSALSTSWKSHFANFSCSFLMGIHIFPSEIPSYSDLSLAPGSPDLTGGDWTCRKDKQ